MRQVKINLVFSIIILLINTIFAQDTLYTRKIINELCSKSFYGRGYAFKGDSIAAQFIAKQMQNLELLTWYDNYQQPYTIGVNTIGKNAQFDFGKSYNEKIEGDNLKIDPMSVATKGKYRIVELENFSKENSSKVLVCIDATKYENDKERKLELRNLIYNNELGVKGYVVLESKQRMASPQNALKKANHCIVYLVKDSVKAPLTTVKINIDANFNDNYKCQNVVGYIKGTKYTDSWYIIGAHYDHLGMMGKKVLYPGAQDNATGVALVLDLARYFSEEKHQPQHNIMFVAFDGEESGLLGSMYLAKNLPISPKNVKMMINLDMVGTGEEGFKIFGIETFPNEWEKIQKLNEKNNYTNNLKIDGMRPNSDHYPFYKVGCPAIFMLTMGKSGKYHHTEDLPENVTFSNYYGLFNMIVDYLNFE